MGRWKDGAQCAVMLTFDLDAETLWLAGDMANISKPGMLSQGAYGAQVAVPLILDLLRRRNLHATFFVPGWTAEKYQTVLSAIHNQGHELGHHGWIHELPTKLSRDQEEHVLQQGIAALRAISGSDPAGYRSPAWEFSANTLDLLKEYGFSYSSNLMSHFLPWKHPDTEIIELPVQWIIDDAPFFLYRAVQGGRSPQTAEHVYQVWSEEFRGIYRHGGLFNLTMHPQIIGRPGRLLMLERFIDFISSFPGLWFATGEEVGRFWSESGYTDEDTRFSLEGIR
jgi:peptidoglycan/xylan/chitin deacetylase (PgdA/CDA1 family)